MSRQEVYDGVYVLAAGLLDDGLRMIFSSTDWRLCFLDLLPEHVSRTLSTHCLCALYSQSTKQNHVSSSKQNTMCRHQKKTTCHHVS